jgi:hypothetical protein
VPAKAPSAAVMRSIADANEASNAAVVQEQRDVAKKLESTEYQAKINESVNSSVKKEEKAVIDAANKRMAEVHARKAS